VASWDACELEVVEDTLLQGLARRRSPLGGMVAPLDLEEVRAVLGFGHLDQQRPAGWGWGWGWGWG